MKEQMLLNEVARLLGKRPYQITYAITSGAVEDVSLRLGGRRIFQPADIERLARHFDIQPGRESANSETHQ
jgi:hypothetical protein